MPSSPPPETPANVIANPALYYEWLQMVMAKPDPAEKGVTKWRKS